MAIKCPKCRTNNPDTQKFCGECGTHLTEIEPEAKTIPAKNGIPAERTETMDTPPIDSLRGKTLAGRYEVIEELGKGGMGRVFKVEDARLKEEIALKLLNTEISADTKNLERFRNELKTARKISHKNVCRMYHLGEDDGKYFITMEYVPGEDLKSTIRRIGQLPVGKSLAIARQVCEGLIEAHRLGIVHRDLKPRNIMIDKEGNAKIMDFGIARILRTKGITKEGIAVGTPEYMAPEQVKGEKADQRSDIYSLGITIFEMVTGRVPFEGDTSLTIALKHKTEPPPNPQDLNSQVPDAVVRLILKCLEKNQENRYQGADELLAELNQIEEDISTKKTILHRRKQTKEASKKRKRMFGLFGLVLVIGIGIAGYLFLGRFRQREEPPAEITGGRAWKSSIAVLPFVDRSLQKDQGPLCEALTEAIIRKLTKIEELRVIPYYSVQKYKDTAKSLQEIRDELNVKTILTPSLQKEGNVVRVSGLLADADEGFVIDSYEYEEKFESVFKFQDDMSRAIASDLKVRLSQEQLVAMTRGETKDPEAYKHFVKGSHFGRKYRYSRQEADFDAAVLNLEKAVAVDKNYVLAIWHLGNVYQFSFIDKDKWKDFELMVKNYEEAYRINPDLAEANVGLGWAYFYKNDWDKAYGFYKKALKIGSNNAEINYYVAGFMKDIGLYQRAIELYSKAIEIDPTHTGYRNLCAFCLMNSGEFRKAESLLREALEYESQDTRLRLFLARQLIMMARYGEAEREIARVENRDPENPGIQYTRGFIHAARGDKEKALAIIKNLDPYVYTRLISSVYALLGMKDEAIQHIQEVMAKGFLKTKTYSYNYSVLINTPFYAGFKDDPRFKEIVRREEKKHRERLRKYGAL